MTEMAYGRSAACRKAACCSFNDYQGAGHFFWRGRFSPHMVSRLTLADPT